MGEQMEEKGFTWVLDDFSSLRDEKCFSPTFSVSGYNWRLVAYPKRCTTNGGGGSLSLYLELADPQSLPPLWRRQVRFTLTILKDSCKSKSNLVLGEQCVFDANGFKAWGYTEFLPLTKIHDKDERFLVDDKLTILAEVHVLPEEAVKVTEEQVAQKAESASKESLDDGGKDISLLNQPKEDVEDDDGAKVVEPVVRVWKRYEDIVSGLRPKNPNIIRAYMNELHSLLKTLRQPPEKLSEEDLTNASNTLADLVDAGSKLDWLKKKLNKVSQDKAELKEASSVNVNGFQVLPSQVESVRRIFEKHPDIALAFGAKNQHLRKACMSFLLSLVETLCQPLEELSGEDLVEADTALAYLKDVGFKVDWLEKKLEQVKGKKEKEESGLAKLKETEEKCAELDALKEKQMEELSATRTPLSLDDLLF